MTIDEIKAAAELCVRHCSFAQRDYAMEDHDDPDAQDLAAAIRTVAEFVLSHPYGVLTKLQWGNQSSGGNIYCSSDSIVGRYTLADDLIARVNGHVVGRFKSIPDGQRLVLGHYSSEMAKAFTKIGDTE